jgi:3-oxoacyl-[acyl-carrier-protein] synthase II
MKQRRVVVTGLGAITPIGLDVPTYWQGLLTGTSGADFIQRFDASQFKTRFACEVKGFDVEAYIDRKEARRMDLFAQYAMAAAEQALADSGLDLERVNRDRIGVIVGSGIGGLSSFEEEVGGYYASHAKAQLAADNPIPLSIPRFNPFFIPKMIVDIASGHISMRYSLRGPNYATVSACATGTNAIIDGYLLIKNGIMDAGVVGGSEAAVTPSGVGGFSVMRALSERNDDPKTASRPFDLDRDGFVLGEGSGILIIEELEHALARGARIYAEITAVGLTADAHHITAPDPEGSGAKRVMQMLLDTSGLRPDEVDYINVHGTSTPLGDVAETKAIKAVFGEHAATLNISSTKSLIGHLLGAAGAVEAIAAILAVHHDTIHPTINHFTDDPECDLNYTFHQPAQRAVRAAISNTFGFGGHNASLLFTKYTS